MYKIKVEGHFSSAHNLRGYKGKCESLHGHNWKVEAAVTSAELDSCGMVMDFKALKQELEEQLSELDHKYLNESPCFSEVNPTSENIARYLYLALKKKVPGLSSVRVWESENSSATYYE